MKKYRSLFVLAATTFALVLTGCGGETPVYKLTVQQDSGVEKVQIFEGETEVTDLTRIEEGTELSAVITLKEDYETTAVKFEGETLTAVSGAYDFVMPAKDATFEVTTKAVEEVPVVETFALTVTRDENVESVKIFDGTSEITDLSKIEKGTTLIAEIKVKAGFSVSAVTLDGKALTSAPDGRFVFEMPGKAATLDVKTSKIINYFALTVAKDEHVTSVDIYQGENKVTDLTKIAEGTNLSAAAVVEAGYEIDAVKLGDTVLSAADGRYAFTMPSAAATLSVTTKKIVNSYALTVNKDDGVESAKIMAGQTEVTNLSAIAEGTSLTAEVVTKANYVVSKVALNGTEVASTAGKYSFVMPSVASTLSITTEQAEVQVNIINDDAKGEVTLTVNGQASADGKCHGGDTVKIVVSPKEGFRVRGLKINGEEITYPDGGYEFSVSQSAYNIEVVYEQSWTVNYLALVDMSAPFTSMTILAGDEVLNPGDKVYPGTELTVQVQAKSTFDDYYLPYIYLYVNDTVLHGNDTSVALNTEKTILSYTFEMEDKALETYVTYNRDRVDEGEGYKVKFETPENVKVLGFEENELYGGNYPTITFVKPEGFVINRVVVKYADGTENEVGSYMMQLQDYGTYAYLRLNIRFSEDVTIAIEGETKEVYNIEYVGADKITVASMTNLPTKGIEGQYYEFQSIRVNDTSMHIADIQIEGIDKESNENYYFTNSSYGVSFGFTMPANAVKITFVIEENGELIVNHDENLESYKITESSSPTGSELTSLAPGSRAYLHLTAKDGYLVNKVVDQDGNELNVVNTTSYDWQVGGMIQVTYVQVTMPADGSNLVLNVTTSLGYSIEEIDDDKVSLTVNGIMDTHAAGETISFSGSLKSMLYTLDDLYIVDATTNEKIEDASFEYTINGMSINGSFVMPARNVKFVAVTGEAETMKANISVVSNVPGVEVSEIVNSFNLNNSQSGVNIFEYKEDLTGKFIENTKTSVGISLIGDYSAKLTYVYGETEEIINVSNISTGQTMQGDATRNYNFADYTLKTGLTEIRLEISELVPLNVELSGGAISSGEITESDLTIMVNGKKVETLEGTIKEGDSVRVTVNKAAEAGYAYIVTLTDVDGEEITDGKVYADFKINIEKVVGYTYTFVNNTMYSYFSCSITLYDSADGWDTFGSWRAGDLLTESGKYMEIYADASFAYTITITIGDKETVINPEIDDWGYCTYHSEERFLVDGNVTITIDPVE